MLHPNLISAGRLSRSRALGRIVGLWTPLRFGLCAGLGAGVLAACSLGPAYHRPGITPPPAWRALPEDVSASWPANDWWQGFQSKQLDALIADAERANDDLGAAMARVAEADAQARIAGAALLPALSASAGVTRQRQVVPGAGQTPLATAHTAELAASYELDFWGKNRASHDSARFAAKASRFDRETVRLSVLSGVATTYFQAVELRDRLRLAEQNLTIAERILEGLALEQKVGTATALDVAQQATSVATLSAAIPPLRQQFGQTVDALAVLVGQPPEAVDLPTSSLNELAEPEVQPGLPSELLARRPDVAEAEAALMAANADVAVARAAFFPSIDLTAGGGFASTALATLFRPESRLYSIGAALTQPIFQGGAVAGQYAYRKARYQELLSGYHKAVISAFSNVEDALIALQQTGEQLQRQQVAAASARRAFELSQAQFHAGTINVLTLLNTETALFSSEDALLQVKFARLHALIDLFSALGGGWKAA